MKDNAKFKRTLKAKINVSLNEQLAGENEEYLTAIKKKYRQLTTAQEHPIPY